METASVAGTSMFMSSGQTLQSLTTSMMKQAAEQQNQIVNMLAQNARQSPQPAASSGSGFKISTYA
ncbi:MAG: hypothetical protein WCP10_01950 [Desulfuromonadales bacterium]